MQNVRQGKGGETTIYLQGKKGGAFFAGFASVLY
jgi:hypothetical protein